MRPLPCPFCWPRPHALPIGGARAGHGRTKEKAARMLVKAPWPALIDMLPLPYIIVYKPFLHSAQWAGHNKRYVSMI
jgi:hypothetical protein